MTSARIYASGAIAFGGWPAINDLLSAKYNTIIVWSIHVDTEGLCPACRPVEHLNGASSAVFWLGGEDHARHSS